MRATRRGFLAGATAAAVLRPASSFAADVDVAIVGAGAAGIGAARTLRKLGKSFAVLEARERPGGRVFTDASLGEPFDAGATFIHWNDTNPWVPIARELGVKTIEEPDSLAFRGFTDGKPTSPELGGRRRAAFQTLSDRLDATDGRKEDLSFADLARRTGGDVLPAASGITLLALGEDPERVSVRDYAELWAGYDRMVPDGYGTLVAKAAAGLPVRYGQPVTEIRWNGRGVELVAGAGTLTAAAAIVTASVGVLQAGAIRFVPALPPATRDAIGDIGMGALTKVALRFDGERFALPAPSDMFDVGAAGSLMNAEAWGFDRNIVLCMFGGDYARGLVRQGEAAAVDHVLGRVAAMLGADARKHFLAGRLAGWSGDPFALGSYSLARVGRYAARAALARPVGGRLWFAGEATAGGGAMTAGGATLAGERAANEFARSVKD